MHFNNRDHEDQSAQQLQKIEKELAMISQQMSQRPAVMGARVDLPEHRVENIGTGFADMNKKIEQLAEMVQSLVAKQAGMNEEASSQRSYEMNKTAGNEVEHMMIIEPNTEPQQPQVPVPTHGEHTKEQTAAEDDENVSTDNATFLSLYAQLATTECAIDVLLKDMSKS